MSGPDRQGHARSLLVAAYVVLLLSPLPLLLYSPPRGADRLSMFAIAIGFLALAAIALQFVTPSRIPRITAPFGIGTLLRFHRHMGSVALVLVLLHAGVFTAHEKRFHSWVFPVHGPLKAQIGWLAGASLVAIMITSTWRRRVHLNYERWRILHILLGVVVLGGAYAHIMMISWYSSVGQVRWLTVLLLVIAACALFYLRFARVYGALGSPYVIEQVVAERGGASTLKLVANGHGGAAFNAGQFAWIKVLGRAYSVTEHPFSYASSAAVPSRPEFTIKGLGDFTSSVSELRPGTAVLIDGPHGAYVPPLPSAGFTLIVGGVGVTPAMSFLRTARDLHDPRPYKLIYGVNTLEDVTFLEEIEHLAHHLNLDVTYVVARPPQGWSGLTGFVNAENLARSLPADARARNTFVCGPPVMIDSVLAILKGLGIPGELVYADRFDSA